MLTKALDSSAFDLRHTPCPDAMRLQWTSYWSQRLDRLFEHSYPLHQQSTLAAALARLGQGRRALYVLKWASILGAVGPDQFKLAGVIELVHLASLWHDDVVDQSRVRRHQPCLHTRLGSHGAILWGDLVLAEALGDALALGDMALAKAVQVAVRAMAVGQLYDGCQMPQAPLVAQTLWVARRKTASLFALACWGVGRLVGASALVCRGLLRHGLVWGQAYQLADDVDELVQPVNTWGPGHDFIQRRWTYPLAWAALSAPSGVVVHHLGRRPSPQWVACHLQPAIRHTRQRIEGLLGRANALTQAVLAAAASA